MDREIITPTIFAPVKIVIRPKTLRRSGAKGDTNIRGGTAIRGTSVNINSGTQIENCVERIESHLNVTISMFGYRITLFKDWGTTPSKRPSRGPIHD